MLDTINAVIEPFFNVIESNINVAAPTGILLLGLVTGLRHSIEADHVAAVLSVVASNHKKNIKRASMLGAIWGLGHTMSLFVAGLVVLLLAVNISETLSNRLEFGVGIMLLFLGVTTLTGWSIGKFFKGLRHQKKSSHKHIHYHQGNVVHSHEHIHNREHGHGHKSLIIGMVHGMAGSGALLLIVLSTINSIPLGLAYIAIFGAGSIGGMAGISTLMGIPFVKLSNSAKISIALRYAAAITTLAIGAGLIYDLVWIDQIFTS
jgi:ABC-type nickel/cobalt efflux system permease component RcnA